MTRCRILSFRVSAGLSSARDAVGPGAEAYYLLRIIELQLVNVTNLPGLAGGAVKMKALLGEVGWTLDVQGLRFSV